MTGCISEELAVRVALRMNRPKWIQVAVHGSPETACLVDIRYMTEYSSRHKVRFEFQGPEEALINYIEHIAFSPFDPD